MSPAGGCSRTTPPSKYPMGAVSRRPAAELLSLLPSLSAPSGVRLAGTCSSPMGGAAGRDRGERWVGGRRTVSVIPEAHHPVPVGRQGRPSALSRACCSLRRWTTAWRPLLPVLPTSARHSPALVRADGPEAWRLQSSAGTATSGDRFEGAGGARTLALPAALDVMPGGHVQDVCAGLPVAKVGGQVACQDGAQHAAGWGGAHVSRALYRGRCDGRAVYGCFLCPLDTSPTPSSSVQPRKPLG